MPHKPSAPRERLCACAGQGGNLHQFIFTDKADGLFQGQWSNGGQDDIVVFSGRPNVGQFLFFAGINVDVLAAIVLADDHALVNRIPGHHEEPAAGFQIEQGIGNGMTGAVGHDEPVNRLGQSPRKAS